MKHFYWTTALILIALLTGCASTPTPTVVAAPSASPTPDHSFISSSGIVSASANVVPAQSSQMGFLIPAQVGIANVVPAQSSPTGFLSATVREVDVKEGDQVK